MRPDMEKVIVERPRWSSDWPNRKFHAALPIMDSDYENEAKFVPSGRGRQAMSRGSTDLLGPLRRFLHKNIGRPWDKVFAEIVEQADDRRLTAYHLLTHVRWEVATDCFLGQDRKLYSGRNVRPVAGFYVHSKTGRLGFIPRPSKRERDRQNLQASPLTEIRIDETRSYRLLDDHWFVVTHEKVFVSRRASSLPERWDVALKQRVRPGYGTNWVGVAKRQCSHEDLKIVRYRVAEWELKLRRM